MTLEEIVQDIHGLDAKLEQSRDVIRWIGYYEPRQERQQSYQIALRERLLTLRQAHPKSLILLQPVPVG